eukprot:3814713-Pyramimonas_sp.AAC.1
MVQLHRRGDDDERHAGEGVFRIWTFANLFQERYPRTEVVVASAVIDVKPGPWEWRYQSATVALGGQYSCVCG